MNEFVLALGWFGLFAPVALGAIGSAIGCAIAGSAAIGAMIDSESGHGRNIGVSLMPSSQVSEPTGRRPAPSGGGAVTVCSARFASRTPAWFTSSQS